jgi:pyruvate dehydrogenase E2 component (dihydrolipoamide acetyltransferase)
MAFEITIPRLGWSMEEGTFVRWLKRDGDLVKPGDAVFELEGEKAAQDIEAVDGGILRIPATAPAEGTVVAVGTVIGYLVAEGEVVPVSSSSPVAPRQGSQSAKKAPEPTVSPSPTLRESESSMPVETPAASPSVRRMAREKGLKLSSIAGSGPAGRIMVGDVQTTSARQPAENLQRNARVASPRARRVARELGIDWQRLAGTGRNGRVRESDVRQAALRANGTGESQRIPISSRRRTIANRMKASGDQTAPVTLTTRVDATNLVNLRTQFKQSTNEGIVPTYSDIVIKLVSLALQQHPMLAVRAEGDQWIVPSMPNGVNIGFAVDTDDGLVVPVVNDVGTLGLFELAKQSAALIEKARSGRLSVAEMQDGVFTITNLGNFGIDAFTPIINLPETAVLGLGRIQKEAVVIDSQIVARDQMTLSLTFDHRIVDGAPAARFLQSVSRAIENPSAWLLRSE